MTDREKVEEFLYREAAILDQWRLKDWLELWIGEGSLYWVPSGHDYVDPEKEVSIVYSDWTGLNQRVMRLDGGFAEDQTPRSRFCRAITNIEVVPAADSLAVVSCFIIGESRGGLTRGATERLFMGRYHHELVPDEDLGFRIKSKKVLLINNHQFFESVSFFF